ncbi:efflux RND transporter periplasmic adaptor subunit [Agaricicola taiwanensis]|nr:efflux RND transporter periplasmic adaptor subunit [Agaricicola taiwanensis]
MRKSIVALGALAASAGLAYVGTTTDTGRDILARFSANEASAQAPAANERGPAAPPPVETAQARVQQSRLEIRSVGTLASDESVTLAAEVAGRVAEIRFAEGTGVQEGDVLVKLDDSLIRAELADAQARRKLAEANYARANSLSQSGIGTARARDEAVANLAIARAAEELAQVRLDKCYIRAPFSGVMGLRQVSSGAYVQAGAAIANLEKIDTLKLDFRLPENNLADVKTGQNVDVIVDALPGKTFSAQIYAIDPQVDVNGRSLRIRARMPNQEGLLRPGLFARINVIGADRGEVVVIPEAAVVPRGSEVFVFKIVDNKAVEVGVELGERRSGEVEITRGLAPGDMVIVSGHNRARDGRPVDIIAQQQRTS